MLKNGLVNKQVCNSSLCKSTLEQAWVLNIWPLGCTFYAFKGGEKHSSVLTNDGLAVNIAEPRLISAGGSFIRIVHSAKTLKQNWQKCSSLCSLGWVSESTV